MKPDDRMRFEDVTTDEDRANNNARFAVTFLSVVHGCPPNGSGLTTCCERPPFELPMGDRLSTDYSLVTCKPAR